MELFLFYAFTAILLSSAFMVIRVENAVHAVLYLVIVFCSHSALLLLLSVEFLALLLLVIYIGAIAILFLFVVMMITLKKKTKYRITRSSYWFFYRIIIISCNFFCTPPRNFNRLFARIRNTIYICEFTKSWKFKRNLWLP